MILEDPRAPPEPMATPVTTEMVRVRCEASKSQHKNPREDAEKLVLSHTCRKCEMTMAACSVMQLHMTSGSVIQTVCHCQMSYDAAGCQNDAAECQNDAAKPHFEGSQDTWMHGFLHGMF